MDDKRTVLRRIASGSVSGAAVIGIIYLVPNWVFALVVAAFVGFGLFEFFKLVTKKGIFVYRYYGTIFGTLIPITAYLRYGATNHDIEPFFIVIISLFVFILQFLRKENSGSLTGISTTLFGILYIGWFFSFLINLKFLPDGSNLVLFLILVTKAGDIGAYAIGTLFGRHSLIPHISPKKSVEGTVGGLLCSFGAALACRGLVHIKELYLVAVIGVLLGVLGQIGDLSESLIKRDCGAKDSGALLPGMGGILDLIDSLLFTTPIFYFFVLLFV